MSIYTAINLVARPEPGPITPELFEVVQRGMPQAGPGQILVKQTYMSLDPAMRHALVEWRFMGHERFERPTVPLPNGNHWTYRL